MTSATTTSAYRRKYVNLRFQAAGSPDRFAASMIQVTPDQDAGYATFEAPTRLSLVRAVLYQAVQENQRVARFGLYKMRQDNPTAAEEGNSGPVADADGAQNAAGSTEVSGGKWNVSRATVDATNGSNRFGRGEPTVVAADASSANANVLATLSRDPRASGGLLPAGGDDAGTIDEPVQYMLDDARAEARRLIAGDVVRNECRNTIVVLVVGGGEGNTAPGADPVGTAGTFLTDLLGRRVPVYVVAIAPPSSDRAQLHAIASKAGGQYFEITKAQIDAALASPSTTYPSPVAGAVVVPELVNAINVAVAHAFARDTDFNTAPTALVPIGPSTEFQSTSPVIGTVDLTSGHGFDQDARVVALTNTAVTDRAGIVIPQRSNVMVTAGVSLPSVNGMVGSLRAFRVYAPVADSSQLSGWKFMSSGQRLWVACLPGPGCATAAGGAVTDSNRRNLYTVTPDGAMVAFTTANVNTLAPLMNLSAADARAVIAAVRTLPLGPIVGSTPAIMNPPSIDPPPDTAYRTFAASTAGRRSLVWVGTNTGMLEAIDARLGVEVWGFIPLNLLPKLKTLRDGQPIGRFDFFVDSSPKIADVKIDGAWRTHLVVGEGAGGTFYQSLDVTMSDMSAAVEAASDDIDALLAYFADPTRIALNWAFPSYTSFDATIAPFGDLKASAPAIEKSVGQTWSDPAIGQIGSASGPYAVVVGSGFFPYSRQQAANRGGAVAGTTFYVLSAKTGSVLDSKNVGNDGVNETVDDCRAASSGCRHIKNALQGDPVAIGTPDPRFVTKVYLGDLDGSLWRFDLALDPNGRPTVSATTRLYSAGSDEPIFGSIAIATVGATQPYLFFGTGSDLLGATDSSAASHLLGVVDNGSAGVKAFDRPLTTGAHVSTGERVTGGPAVAGDVVFFTTTTVNDVSACVAPSARLYAFTFIGGPAYDNTGDSTVTGRDTAVVNTIAGHRASAPIVVDQHVVFAAGPYVQLFGDPQAYNNGVGQAGVRILSWREVR